MVVKPLDFVVRGKRGYVQPAVKCRGREHLRIIYGPDYTEPANLERLRKRSLTGKRMLALREFALGMEALERFVARQPLWRVLQAVFAVLAHVREPVDPRLCSVWRRGVAHAVTIVLNVYATRVALCPLLRVACSLPRSPLILPER